MRIPTHPNPIYTTRQAERHGGVDRAAWAAALIAAGSPTAANDAKLARANFNKVRKAYWLERLRLAMDLEFNVYNQMRIQAGKAPIGPDGFSMELEHRIELNANPPWRLNPTTCGRSFVDSTTFSMAAMHSDGTKAQNRAARTTRRYLSNTAIRRISASGREGSTTGARNIITIDLISHARR